MAWHFWCCNYYDNPHPISYIFYYTYLQQCEIAGYLIPSGAQVAYISHAANRDKDVFAKPDDFYPDRWKNECVTVVCVQRRSWVCGTIQNDAPSVRTACDPHICVNKKC